MLEVSKMLFHGDVLTLPMKTLLTSWCVDQRGAGHVATDASLISRPEKRGRCPRGNRLQGPPPLDEFSWVHCSEFAGCWNFHKQTYTQLQHSEKPLLLLQKPKNLNY
ncbi:hypothetical protein F3J29_13105 [Enterobacter sp. Cy-643]|nr:hypothetical protein [Enterobacter sp. Cy-643]